MVKLRDKITVSFVKMMINVNPEKKDRVIKKFKRFSRWGKIIPYKLKRGFERTLHNSNGVSVEIFKRKGTEPKKLIYIIHGGGFIIGLINVYRNLHSIFSSAANGAAVAIVDYRTAPEYRYPAAHDDVLAGWNFLQELGYNPSDIVLVGDSAGGNLVLSLLLKLRDEEKPMPAAAAVMSPWADLSASGNSYRNNYCNDAMFGRRGNAPDEEEIQRLLQCDVFSYAKGWDRSDPYLSPVYGEYRNFPPLLMTVGSHEILLDDTLTVAEKIKKADGKVKVVVGEGMFHVYPLFHKVSPLAKAAFKEILAFLKEHTSEIK